MLSKLENLRKLKEKININIEGVENYPVGEKTIIFSNHNCLMDIFYLPLSIPCELVSVVSSRLLFKPLPERQKVINQYLNAVPLEANGGRKYADLCIDNICDLFLNDNISLNIFPEGGYFPGKNIIYKGKTGAARMLYKVRKKNCPVTVVPVAIHIPSDVDDIDSYNYSGYPVTVKILSPIDYEEDFYCYKNSSAIDEKNRFLHSVIDKSMKKIADSINVPYIDQYMNYVVKDSIILPNGSFINNNFSDDEKYINVYNDYYKKRNYELVKTINNK